MRTKRDLRIGTLLTGLSVLGLHSSCGAKKQSNEGFPPTLEELNSQDYEDSFWKLVREKLQIPAIEGDDVDQLEASLSELPLVLTDTDLAQEMVAQQASDLVATAEQSVCDSIEVPLVDLNPGSAYGIDGGFSVSGGVPTALQLKAKVYRMRYKLKGDTEFRQAIVTVPVTAPAQAHAAVPSVGVQTETSGSYGYPIFMYGHAGSSGLAYTEIASSLGALQSAFIIAAPAFPGEPLCKTYDASSSTCTGDNILSAAVGTALPYENDVVDYLGLHDCMKSFAAGAAKAWANPSTNATGTEDLSAKVVKISALAQTYYTTASNAIKAAAAGAPVSIAAGMGRGAAVAGLALARAGAYNQVFTGSDTAAISTLAGKGAAPALFSCSIIASPQATLVSGSNRLFLESWVREGSNILTESETTAGELIPGFSAIHAKIKGIREDATLDAETKATQIVSYVNGLDLVAHTQLLHYGLQNFGKVFTADRIQGTDISLATATKAASQGSLMLLHGTKDKVATVGNSAIFSQYGVSVSAALVDAGATAGVRWLGLGIDPPEAYLDESGDLISGDYGHVNNASFTSGKSSLAGGLESNVNEDSFLGKTPSELIALYLSSQCADAMNANSSQ